MLNATKAYINTVAGRGTSHRSSIVNNPKISGGVRRVTWVSLKLSCERSAKCKEELIAPKYRLQRLSRAALREGRHSKEQCNKNTVNHSKVSH